LFVTDHSVMVNSLGGPNPTNTRQALAAQTAETILDRYFPSTSDDRIGVRSPRGVSNDEFTPYARWFGCVGEPTTTLTRSVQSNI
jgi:hypothetical protein